MRYFIAGLMLLAGSIISLMSGLSPMEGVVFVETIVLAILAEKVLVFSVFFSTLMKKGVLDTEDIKKMQSEDYFKDEP